MEVILRDFDGTETVFPKDPPLPEIIRTGDTATGLLVTRRYLKTQQTDRDGRVIYEESKL